MVTRIFGLPPFVAFCALDVENPTIDETTQSVRLASHVGGPLYVCAWEVIYVFTSYWTTARTDHLSKRGVLGAAKERASGMSPHRRFAVRSQRKPA